MLITRADFRKLTLIRLREATILLDRRQYDGAYYLCGYAVECGLKACISKTMKRFQYPPRPESIRNYYTHDLKQLLKSADLQTALETEWKIDTQLEVNWGITAQWSEQSRYIRTNKADAAALYDAVSDNVHGVIQWIRRHW
jgi:HEPN domain-containing protein